MAGTAPETAQKNDPNFSVPDFPSESRVRLHSKAALPPNLLGRKILLVRRFSRTNFQRPPLATLHLARSGSPKNLPTNKIFLPKFPRPSPSTLAPRRRTDDAPFPNPRPTHLPLSAPAAKSAVNTRLHSIPIHPPPHQLRKRPLVALFGVAAQQVGILDQSHPPLWQAPSRKPHKKVTRTFQSLISRPNPASGSTQKAALPPNLLGRKILLVRRFPRTKSQRPPLATLHPARFGSPKKFPTNKIFLPKFRRPVLSTLRATAPHPRPLPRP